MSDLLSYIPALILILGPAVILHEFGHFIVAKLLRIRVETFSVGFGPRLFGRRWGATDYRVSLVPLGGYVKLGGDESNAPIEGEGESDIPAHERFDLRPRRQKFLVMVAGPVMNILTALAIVFGGALKNGVPASPVPVVDRVAEGGTSERAGLKPGDRILSINGEPGGDETDVRNVVRAHKSEALRIQIVRNGQQQELTTGTERLDGDKIGVNAAVDLPQVSVGLAGAASYAVRRNVEI